MNANIDLSKQLLPVYHNFFNNKQYYNILFGGRGSGKSRATCQKIIYRILTEQSHIFVIIRDKMTDHTNSTVREFKEVIEQWGIESICEFLKAPMTIRIPSCKSEILFLGMDDPQRLKGLSGVTGLWFEEISQLREQSSFEEVMSGFRPDQGKNFEQVIMTFNPVSKDHWLKKRFFDMNPDKDRTYILRTTYLDNPYLNSNTVQTLLNLRFTDEMKYRINVLGEWGSVQDGKEFYKMFRYGKHVDALGECLYNPNLPLHLSFDFNVLPHMTMLIIQVIGKEIRVIDEIIGISPHNTTHGICSLFKSKYPYHEAGVFIYGDPSGKARSTVTHDYDTNFFRISSDLHDYHPILRVGKSAPRVAIRGQWINQIFATCLDNINILINPNCQGLITDFMELQEDFSGLKHKEMVRVKGAAYEKYGHWTDCFDYFITECFKPDYLRFSKRSMGLTNLTVVSRLPHKYRH